MEKTRTTPDKETNPINLNGALLKAAGEGELKRIGELLDQGASANATDEDGKTPLILFVESGHTQCFSPLYVLSFFFLRGAKINAQDKEGNTALHAVAKGGLLSPELLEAFVKYGADTEVLSHPPRARTPLQLASEFGFLTAPLFEAFRKAGANLKIRNSEGQDIADLSAGAFDVSLFRLFAKYGVAGVSGVWEHDLNACDKWGDTALTWCADNEMFDYDTNLLEDLLANGADPNGVNDDGENFLMVMAKRLHISGRYIDIFLRWGGNADRRNKSGENLLFFIQGTEDVKTLLLAGADPNARSLSGMTPLMEGMRGEFYYETAPELFRGGADPTRGWGSETPLFLYLTRSPVRIGMRFMEELLGAGYSVCDLLGTDDMILLRKNLREEIDNGPYIASYRLSPVPALAALFALCGLYAEKSPVREIRLREYLEQHIVLERDLRDVFDSVGNDASSLPPALASGLLEVMTALYEHPALTRGEREKFFGWDPRKVKIIKLLLSCLSGDDKDRGRETAVRFMKTCCLSKELEKWSTSGIEGIDKLVATLVASLRDAREESLKDSFSGMRF